MAEPAIAANVALNLGRAQPALSATSDGPTEVISGPALSAVGTEIPAARVEQAADAPLGDEHRASDPAKVLTEGDKRKDVPVVEKTAEEIAADAADPAKKDAKDDTPAWQKAEVTKERNRRREAETRANDADVRLETALKALEALTQKPVEEVAAAPRPVRTNFDTPEAYDAALEKWTTDKVAAATRAETLKEVETQTAAEKAEAEQKAQAEQIKAVLDTWNDRAAKAVEQFPDFEEVVYREVKDGGPNVTAHMRDAILTTENGAAVAYHLGTNVAEAARISALSPVAQLIEMGRLSAQLEAQAKPRLTKAPTPPTHINDGNSASPKTLYELGSDPGGMDAYAAQRTERLRSEARH